MPFLSYHWHDNIAWGAEFTISVWGRKPRVRKVHKLTQLVTGRD